MGDTNKSIIFSLFGFFLFSLGDILRKLVLVNYSATEVQVWASIASVMAILLVSNQIGGIKSITSITKPHIHFLKAILVTIMMGCAVFSLERLTLDVFYTLVFTTPMITSLLAAIFLGEKLTVPKLLLISIGFLGVIFITRPSANVDLVGIILTFGLALSFAVNSLLNKSFKPDEAKFPFGFFPYLLAAIVFFILNQGQFPDLDTMSMLFCFLAGACSVFGVVLHVYAFQLAKASVASPYQYTQLVWGVLFGFLLFGDTPDFWIISGATIIVTSGLLLYLYDTQTLYGKK